MNIVLIGARCSGKSSVGKILAMELGRRFLDSDILVEERGGLPLHVMISEKGWDHFRGLEREVVAELSNLHGVVIATGGGVVTDEGNVMLLKGRGFLVWLRADPSVLGARMALDPEQRISRPPLGRKSALDEISDVLTVRSPLYRRAADMEVDTSGMNPHEAARVVIGSLPSGRSWYSLSGGEKVGACGHGFNNS